MTFISPCVLPLIPAYLSFITGVSLDELRGGRKAGANTVLSAVFFVIGFGTVFTLLGASASLLGNLLYEKKDVFKWIGGLLVIIFGLHVSGLVRIPFLYYEKRVELKKSSLGFAGSFLIGMAFAVGWTPCVGPILSSVLLLASTQGTAGKGILLLAAYSLGLGVPFILAGVFITRAVSVIRKIQRYFRMIEMLSGTLLVIVGIMILTGGLEFISRYVGGILAK